MSKTNLQDGVFSVVLITDSEQLSVLLSCTEAQLHLRREAVGLKA